MTQPLTAAALARWLAPDMDWRLLEQTGSTQADLMQAAKAKAPRRPTLLVAHAQTAGRGRRGRAWLAEPGDALTFSMALPWARPPAQSAAVTLSIATQIARTLERHGVEVTIKWPNDVLLAGGKLAGLLVEYAQDLDGAASLVVGLGLNLRLSAQARAQIDQAAAALRDAPQRHPTLDDAGACLALLANAILEASGRYAEAGFAPDRTDFLQRCAWLGDEVSIAGEGAPITGVLRDIDTDGRLWIESPDGVQRAIVSGELSLRAHPGLSASVGHTP